MTQLINFTLNGMPVCIPVEPEMTLLAALRDRAGLTSPKCGCNKGDCGACTVIMDGKAVKSCTVLAMTVEGRRIVTVDGLARGEELHPLQRAFFELGAVQCGYCTPGMIMAATAFLLENPQPDELEIKTALSGNLCRCGGYKKYVEAVLAVSRGDYGPLPEGCDLHV